MDRGDGGADLRPHPNIDADLHKMRACLDESYELFQKVGDRFENINFGCLLNRIKDLSLINSATDNETKAAVEGLRATFDASFERNKIEELTKNVQSVFTNHPGEFGDIPELTEYYRTCSQLQRGLENLRQHRNSVLDLGDRMTQVADSSFRRIHDIQGALGDRIPLFEPPVVANDDADNNKRKPDGGERSTTRIGKAKKGGKVDKVAEGNNEKAKIKEEKKSGGNNEKPKIKEEKNSGGSEQRKSNPKGDKTLLGNTGNDKEDLKASDGGVKGKRMEGMIDTNSKSSKPNTATNKVPNGAEKSKTRTVESSNATRKKSSSYSAREGRDRSKVTTSNSNMKNIGNNTSRENVNDKRPDKKETGGASSINFTGMGRSREEADAVIAKLISEQGRKLQEEKKAKDSVGKIVTRK